MHIVTTERILSLHNLSIERATIANGQGETFERYIIDPGRHAVAAVTVRDGKFLLIQTKRFLRNGTWEIPGGWMEDGEVALSAVRRKVQEETGFEVKSINRLGNAFCGIGMTRKEHFYFIVQVGEQMRTPNGPIEKVGLFTTVQIQKMIENADIVDERSLAGFTFAHAKGYL